MLLGAFICHTRLVPFLKLYVKQEYRQCYRKLTLLMLHFGVMPTTQRTMTVNNGRVVFTTAVV